jgi:hypothetical protein|tara:strand:- start:612 stop:866 length:255 start_codon:yes stop_codon:yes gene_type:complete
MNKTTLQIGQAYIVNGVPMVLRSIEGERHMFTDGRYGFGRTLGRLPRDSKILDSLKIAEGVNPQHILNKLEKSVSAMASFMRNR